MGRPPKWLIRLIGRLQAPIYRATGGRMFGRVGKAAVLLLTTTGRKTGVARTVPLLFVPDGERFVIVASQGGHDTNPAWYLNLCANPAATVQVGKQITSVQAEELDAEAEREIWPRLVAAYPAWETYRDRTGRSFPVMLLTPR